jgi:hypothetical protein
MPSSTRGIDLPPATSSQYAHTLVVRGVALSDCGVVSIGTRAITVQCPSLCLPMFRTVWFCLVCE